MKAGQDSRAIAGMTARADWLRTEIKRVSSATLRGSFSSPEDLQFWVRRLEKLNSELSSIEQLLAPARLIRSAT